MKFKTPVFSALRGKLGHTIDSGTLCFRTYKNFGLQVIKNPARKVDPAGKQWLHRHQLYCWSLHWNFLTPEQKAEYENLGAAAGLSGYDYYIKEKCDPQYLYVHPVAFTWTEKKYPSTLHYPGESVLMSDDSVYEKHMYIKFPLAMISSNLDAVAASLSFFYYEEAGWDADDRRVDCRSILEDWDWRTLTWNNAPPVDPDVVSYLLMPGQMEWFTFDVFPALLKAIADPHAWFGFHIRFKDLEPTQGSFAGIRATLPHDNDYWPFLKLKMW